MSENGFRVLVVDDNPDIHWAMKKALQPEVSPGARIATMEEKIFGEFGGAAALDTEIANFLPSGLSLSHAYQGEEALSLVKALGPDSVDLAFVDIRMPPGMDGLETIQRLWDLAPDVHVVICTAYSDFGWPQIQRRLGQLPHLLFLRKPAEVTEIRQITRMVGKLQETLGTLQETLAETQVLVAQCQERLRSMSSEREVLVGALEILASCRGKGVVVIDRSGRPEWLSADARALLGVEDPADARLDTMLQAIRSTPAASGALDAAQFASGTREPMSPRGLGAEPTRFVSTRLSLPWIERPLDFEVLGSGATTAPTLVLVADPAGGSGDTPLA